MRLKMFEDLTKTRTDCLCCSFTKSSFVLYYFLFIVCRDYCWKYSHTLWPCFFLTILLNWRHLIVWGCWLPTQVHKIQCHLFPQIYSLSPSCHLSAWQHKVIASRCNQDYMLVTHSRHSVPYNMWNRHKIKPVHRWEDKILLNIHQFSDCSDVSPECCH